MRDFRLAACALWVSSALVGVGCTTGDVDPLSTGTIDGGVIDVNTDGANDSSGPGVDADAPLCEEEEGPPPEPGAFSYPCTSNSECNSGWCIASPKGTVCTRTCVEECPEGYGCRQLTLGDPVFLCLPKFLHLCDPCETNSDCRASEADGSHYCLDLGAEGKFCGGDCSSSGECPCGYDCRSVPVGGGQIAAQCVPAAGTSCSCSPLATSFQDRTSCVITNENGSCVGSRYCSPNGLTECDARVPEAEICNGLDDNCDGAFDNLPPDYQCAKTNEFGTCLGAGTCIGGVEICDAPSATPEICDGLDNDCNGVTDDGFPDTDGDLKSDCIDEDDDNDLIPDVSDNCVTVANEGQENNDGDQQGDACDEDDDNDSVPDNEDCAPLDGTVSQNAVEQCDNIDNNCNGETDDNLCDDGEPCTEDSCNADGSCAHQPLNGISCADGEGLCTVNDVCLNGVCTGNPVNCDDGNVCTQDICNPGNGECTNLTPTLNGEPCDDGSECTVNDECNNGICNGTYDITQCDDGNECTNDFCQSGSCVNAPAAANSDCTATYQAQSGQSVPQCNVAQCNASGQCLLKSSSNGQSCNYSGSVPACKQPQCLNGQCSLSNVSSGSACTTSFSDCPNGTCTSGGQCLATPGLSCNYDPDFCDSDGPGVCASNGECEPVQSSSCSCPGCGGVAVCCTVGFFQLTFCVGFDGNVTGC